MRRATLDGLLQKSCIPYFVLLVEVLAFYRKVLFLPDRYQIPWDLRYYHHSIAYFVAKCFREGALPLWDPYAYCGFPLYANLTMGLFYPPMVLSILLSNLTGGSLVWWLEVQVAGHVFLAAALAFRLLSRLKAGLAASLIGASVYSLGSFFASQSQHLGAVSAAAWLPLAWLSVFELSERFRWRWVAGLAFALAMSLLAGFPAVSIPMYACTCFLALILVLLRRARWPLLPAVALAVLWSAGLSLIQLLPTRELTRESVAAFRGDWLGSGGGIPIQALYTLLHPNYWGVFQFDGRTYGLPWNPTFLYLYCGIAPLIGVLGALILRRHRLAVPLSVLTLVSTLWMLGDKTPVGRAVFAWIPNAVKAPLYAEFVMPSFALGMALLAGLGAHSWLEKRNKVLPWIAVIVVAADLIAVGSGRPINTADLNVEPGIGHGHYDRSSEPPRRLRELANSTLPPGRIDIYQGSLHWPSHAPLFEVPTASGNDPFALVRLMQVRLLFCQGQRWGRYYEVTSPESPVLDLLNVRYLVSRPGIDAQALEKAGFRKIGEPAGHWVFENPKALPRFFLVNRVRRAADMRQALSYMRSSEFDPGSTAVVEGEVDAVDSAPAAGTVRTLEYGNRKVVLEVDAPAAAFLVTSETYYPGWKAWLDGRQQSLVLTNAAFRGMRVPAGKHRIVMLFDPPILKLSAALSIFPWLLFVAVWIWGDNLGNRRGLWTSLRN